VFAREFYCAIAEGSPVDAAVCESRKALFNEDFGQEWATPVLYMRSQEGQLFDLQAPATGLADTKASEHERAEAERHAAEIAEAERAAAADKERQERERAEQARLAAEKEEAQRIAAAESERQAQEKAERERLAREQKEAERRAAEKAEAQRAAAVAEEQRQAREQVDRERQAREQFASENLARASSEPLPAAQAQTPAPPTLATPTPAPRRGLPMWQILLLFIPFVGVILALSWHHLRPHSDDARSPEQQSSESRNATTETPTAQTNPAVATPQYPAVVSPKPNSRVEPPTPKPTNANLATPKPSNVDKTAAKPSNVDLAAPKTSNNEPSEKSATDEKPASPPPADKPVIPASPSRIRVNAISQNEKVVSRVSPVYPPLAAQGNISGEVELRVVINKDGTVQNTTVTSGDPLLAQSATDAVMQWRYSPTLVNNQPVEVETTVLLKFSLKTKDSASLAASTASLAQPPAPAPAPCTLGRVDFKEGGTSLFGTVPFTYTGNSQLQTLAILGIPLTTDKKRVPGVKLAESTLKDAAGTASFSMESHPSLGQAGPTGEYVLVALTVKSTGEIVCEKIVPYHRAW
jgi:TonB family protein